MKVQGRHSVGVAAVSAALLLLSTTVVCTTSDLTENCVPELIANAFCDEINNYEACGYDGGDCCECTCVDTEEHECGGFNCLDPSAACFDGNPSSDSTSESDDSESDSTTSTSCRPEYFSDGECDLQNNTEDCGYDGGDCCDCTCVDTEDLECGVSGFACIDPSASCVDDDDVTTNPDSTTESDPITCWPQYYSDGDCDGINNNEECGYDGGDCCSCTCVNTEDYTCGENGGFTCLDPSAECVDDDDDDETTVGDDDSAESETHDTNGNCVPSFFSDGDCDLGNNNEECGYDGGDCCECTCVSTANFSCGKEYHGGYTCVDPNASCFGDDDDTSTPTSGDDTNTDDASTSCFDEGISDGFCFPDNNNEACGYDGGDCCECDCVSSDEFTCGDAKYDCVNPTSSCFNGYVLASTKTTVGVSANAYDVRPGQDSDDIGCNVDGCKPALSRDGISDDIESRWSCAQKIVPDGGLCEIEFTFSNPQDIKEVQVAFWKGDERSRTLEASINGEIVGEFDSYPGSTFNALGIEGVGVSTLTLTSIGLPNDDWISLIEVRFLVEA
eukprot:jgi/Undpi1/12711/HiC_scaffold_6.g02379.m1